jgi:protein phosphatase
MSVDPKQSWRIAMSRSLDQDRERPASADVEIEVAGLSEAGVQQALNDAHYLAIRLGRLQETLVTSLAAADLPPRFEEYAYAMLVADGLNGNASGARASRLALSALAQLAIEYGQWNVRIQPDNFVEVLEQGEWFYRRVNETVRQAGRVDIRLANMATSLTVAYIAGKHMFFAHAGHSRAYVFREGVLVQLTHDHTVKQNRMGDATQYGHEPHRVVTTSIGSSNLEAGVQIEHMNLYSGDRVLLCTSGLTDVLSDEQIADVMALHRRPKDDCRRLVDLAHAAGSRESVTVLTADYRLRRAVSARLQQPTDRH